MVLVLTSGPPGISSMVEDMKRALMADGQWGDVSFYLAVMMNGCRKAL